MYIIIALLISLSAIILDWQKDKSSFLQALKMNWPKYIIMFVVGSFLFGYLMDLTWFRYIFAGLSAVGVYFLWTLIIGLFKPKPKA